MIKVTATKTWQTHPVSYCGYSIKLSNEDDIVSLESGEYYLCNEDANNRITVLERALEMAINPDECPFDSYQDFECCQRPKHLSKDGDCDIDNIDAEVHECWRLYYIKQAESELKERGGK